MCDLNFFKRNINKKSISPLIATILLIVVAISIIVIVLSWSRTFAGDSLSFSTELIYNKSNVDGFIRQNERMLSNNIIIENQHLTETITIIGYKIHSEKDAYFLNEYFYLEADFNKSPIIITPSQVEELDIPCFPENEFNLELVLDDNTFTNIRVRNKNFNFDTCNPCSGLPYIEYSGSYLCIHPKGNGTSQWGCRGTSVIPNPISTLDGFLNTKNIVFWHEGWQEPWNIGPGEVTCNSSNNGTIAARNCYDLNEYGFDDWYLPAIEQLEFIWTVGNGDNLSLNQNIEKGIYLEEWENIIANWYWSSTEVNSNQAMMFSMLSSDDLATNKTSNILVRCVRDH